MRIFRPILVALLMTIAGAAQIPAPQLNLTGNIGCQGFPCLNNGILTMTDANRAMTVQETSAVGGFKVTGTWTANRTLTMPSGRFQFVAVENGTSGGFSLILCGSGSGACLTIPAGQTAAGVWYDGTNVVGNLSTGGGGLSGQVAGYAVEAATATTATGPFPLDNGITDSNFITAQRPFEVITPTDGDNTIFQVHAPNTDCSTPPSATYVNSDFGVDVSAYDHFVTTFDCSNGKGSPSNFATMSVSATQQATAGFSLYGNNGGTIGIPATPPAGGLLVNSGAGVPSQMAFTYSGTALVPGSATTVVFGADGSGNALVCEGSCGTPARICDATNGVCGGGGGLPTASAPGQFPASTTAGTTYAVQGQIFYAQTGDTIATIESECSSLCTYKVTTPQTLTITGNHTLASNVQLDFGAGGQWTVNGAFTLTIPGNVTGTLNQHFAGSAGIVFGTSQAQVPVEWFGAVGYPTPITTGSACASGTDSTAAIQSALNAVAAGAVILQAQCYRTTSALSITRSRVGIEGTGALFTVAGFYSTTPPSSMILSTSASADIVDVGGTSTSAIIANNRFAHFILQRNLAPTGTANGLYSAYMYGISICGVTSNDSIYDFHLVFSGDLGGAPNLECGSVGQYGGFGFTEGNGTYASIYVDSTSGNPSNSFTINGATGVSEFTSTSSIVVYGLLIQGSAINDQDVDNFSCANVWDCVHINYTGSGAADSEADLHIRSLTSDTYGNAAVYVNGMNAVSGGPSLEVRNGWASGGPYGLECINSDGVTYSGMLGADSVSAVNANGCSGMTISGNTMIPFSGFSTVSVLLNNVVNSTINGNSIGMGNASYDAVQLTGTSTGNTFTGNAIMEPGRYGFNLSSGSTANTGWSTNTISGTFSAPFFFSSPAQNPEKAPDAFYAESTATGNTVIFGEYTPNLTPGDYNYSIQFVDNTSNDSFLSIFNYVGSGSISNHETLTMTGVPNGLNIYPNNGAAIGLNAAPPANGLLVNGGDLLVNSPDPTLATLTSSNTANTQLIVGNSSSGDTYDLLVNGSSSGGTAGDACTFLTIASGTLFCDTATGMAMSSTYVYGITSGSAFTTAIDTAISRGGTGVLDVGNGTAGDHSATVLAGSLGLPSTGTLSWNADSFLFRNGSSGTFGLGTTSSSTNGILALATLNASTDVSANTLASVGSGNIIQASAINTATSSNNYNSGALEVQGSIWNGSTSATDIFEFTNSVGSGTNPSVILSLGHTGSTGPTTFQLPSTLALTWNGDTGISRLAAGSFGFGNGVGGDTSGTVGMANVNASGNIVAEGSIKSGAFSGSGTATEMLPNSIAAIDSGSVNTILLTPSSGHLSFNTPTGGAPVVSSCGGGTLAANSSDNSFGVTGLSVATSCTVTFAHTLSQGFCVANSSVVGTPLAVSPSTTAVTFSMAALTGSIYAHCF